MLRQDLEAVKALDEAPTPEMAVTFIGLVGIRDPPRKVRRQQGTSAEVRWSCCRRAVSFVRPLALR